MALNHVLLLLLLNWLYNKDKTRWFILVAQERYKDSNIEFKIELRQGSCEKTSRSSSQATTLYVEETELVNDIEISIFK